jgi:alkylation response protein AidB-like acyl-CoA dehydrogenase
MSRAPAEFLTTERRMVQAMAGDFTRKELAPHAARWLPGLAGGEVIARFCLAERRA